MKNIPPISVENFSFFFGAHTVQLKKFFPIQGELVCENGDLFFVNGSKQEAWKDVPYKHLEDGDFLGIKVSAKGSTLQVKGVVRKFKIKDDKSKREKSLVVWENLSNGIRIPISRLMERVASLIDLSDKANIFIVIWK